jgi:hypothetical protein
MIIVAGFALMFGMLRNDLGVDELDRVGQVWGKPQQLLRDPGSRWLGAASLVGWYLLAGLAISGPLLGAVRRGVPRWAFSGRFLWFGIGALTWLSVSLAYAPQSLAKTIDSFDFQWEDQFPTLHGVMQFLIGVINPWFHLFAFFCIPIATLCVISAYLSHEREWRQQRLTSVDIVGLCLGILWCVRDGLLVCSVFLYPGAFFELP